MRIDFDLLSATIVDLYAGVGDANALKAALQRIRTLFSASRVALVTRLANYECFYYEDHREAEGVRDNASTSLSARVDGPSSSPITLHTGKICSNCISAKRTSRLCCCVAGPKGDAGCPSIHLSVHREAGSPFFDESDRRALERLAPHVLQVVQLSSRIETAEKACTIGSQVLEEVRRGVVVLNSLKEVVFMNRRAEAICTSARGVTVCTQPTGCRTLKATSAAEDLVFQRALDGALGQDAKPRPGSPSSDAVRIGSSHSSRPLLIRLARLPLASSAGGSAVLFMDDLAAIELGDDRLLTALFGLTRAEVRIAGALLAGERPKAIAIRFAVSEDTVRTQLRAVYVKTETSGLSALLALLSRLADVPVLEVSESAAEPTPPIASNRRQAPLRTVPRDNRKRPSDPLNGPLAWNRPALNPGQPGQQAKVRSQAK